MYLGKRRVDKLEELGDDIADDDYLFADERSGLFWAELLHTQGTVLYSCRLTKREKNDAEYKETLFRLAKEHEKVAMVCVAIT